MLPTQHFHINPNLYLHFNYYNMKKFTLAIITLFITVFSFAQSTGNIILNKGQKLVLESSSKIVATQEMMGQSMEINTDIKSSNTIEVKGAGDTSYALTNTLTKLQMAASAMGQDMSYDS